MAQLILCTLLRPNTGSYKAITYCLCRFEDRPEVGYSVATSPAPGGPFKVVKTDVRMPGQGRIADLD